MTTINLDNPVHDRARYRRALPQLDTRTLLTDGGMETTLIYHERIDLPAFAAFVLLENDTGIATLRTYYQRYLDIARRRRCGMILESPTWRANRDWGAQLGYGGDALARINHRSIDLLEAIRTENADIEPIVISGNIGPRGDGYIAEKRMSLQEAADYHSAQIAAFATTAADLVSAFTLNYVEEAIGIVTAAREQRMPVVIAFTLETDGNLPSGQPLRDAI